VVGDDGGLHKDPDRRVQQAITLVFDTFLQLGSARQAFLRLREHGTRSRFAGAAGTPASTGGGPPTTVSCASCATRSPRGLRLRPPQGAQRLGSDGRVHRVSASSRAACDVLIANHHEGYIAAQTCREIQPIMASNS
jgi:hypothetical protein